MAVVVWVGEGIGLQVELAGEHTWVAVLVWGFGWWRLRRWLLCLGCCDERRGFGVWGLGYCVERTRRRVRNEPRRKQRRC